MIELLAGIAISVVLLVVAAGAVSRFGSLNKIKREADRLADQIWAARSQAISGVRNPCLDFPAPDSVRVYSDTTEVPDGFGTGDKVLGGYRYQGGIRALLVTGGTGSTHFVCFRTRGITGSAGAPLDVTLGTRQNDPANKHVRLLPSTGMAKVK